MGDFGNLAKRVKKLPKKMENSLDSEVGNESKAMSMTANRKIADNNSIASGEMMIRTQAEKIQRPEHFTTHAVRAKASHAKFVEYGTGFRGEDKFKSPGSTPPIDNILSWIIDKGIQPYAYDTQYELAMAIAKIIEIYGNKPHPFMRPAWREHRANFSARGNYGVSKALRRL